MDNRTKISGSQLILLTVGSALMLPYTSMSILNNAPNNHDVWIVPLLAIVYFAVFNAPIIYIVFKYRELSFHQIFEKLTSKIAGKIIAVLYAVLLSFSFLVYLFIITQFIVAQLMPETPVWILLLLALVPVCYGAVKGAGVIAKVSLFIVPFILLSVAVFALFGIKLFDVYNILPVLKTTGFWQLNKGAFLLAANSTEIVIFLMFSCHLKKGHCPAKSYVIYLLSTVVFTSLIVLPSLLALGYRFSSVSLNTYYNFIRQVQFYKSIERVQALNALINFPAILLRLSLYCYMACKLLHETFKKVPINCFAYGFCVASFVLTLSLYQYRNFIIKFYANSYIYAAIALSLTFLVPLLAIICHKLIRNRKN